MKSLDRVPMRVARCCARLRQPGAARWPRIALRGSVAVRYHGRGARNEQHRDDSRGTIHSVLSRCAGAMLARESAIVLNGSGCEVALLPQASEAAPDKMAL